MSPQTLEEQGTQVLGDHPAGDRVEEGVLERDQHKELFCLLNSAFTPVLPWGLEEEPLILTTRTHSPQTSVTETNASSPLAQCNATSFTRLALPPSPCVCPL